jgi:hypothetical protein
MGKIKERETLMEQNTKQGYIVATIDLTTECDPDYTKLDEVLAEHGLFSSQPKAWSSIPRNTYVGKAPEVLTLHQFAEKVFNAVKAEGLCPNKLLIVETSKDIVTITD